ncbi:amino acid adenylation domain-containing protein [Micromonospora sp. DT227]|uniref:amino acid adenylation domain-containing protein n=1 Tax=Micromonospora sp. DT227 TaxID=3393433 RepID=UPI003CF0514E
MTTEAVPTSALVARHAATRPAAVALADGDREVTYAELDSSADRLAGLLVEQGLRPGDPVGVLLRRRAELVIALLAIWRAGGAYLPLAPDHPAQRLRDLLAGSGTRLALTEADTRAPVEAVGARAVVLDDALATSAHRPAEPALRPIDRDSAAYVLFTSGSTGRPKGVVIPHAGFDNQLAWRVRCHGFGAADRVLFKTPVTFDAAGWEIFAALRAGGTVVVAPDGAERDPASLVRLVAEHGVTVLQVVPSLLRALVHETGWDRCTGLRLLSSGGEQLTAELVQDFLAEVEDHTEPVTVWNTYGPTECSIEAVAQEVDPLQRSGPVAIGRAIEGIRTVLDGDEGELLLGGVGLAHGYLNDAALTAERFVPDPAGDGARLYRTGDRVRRRADGALEFTGRLDDQLKINGVRIEPGEVEAAMLEHPAVRAAAVSAYRAPSGAMRLAAYPVAAPGADLTTLSGFLATRLPATHLPAAIVPMDALPSTSSGKVDRRALPVPDTGSEETSDAPASPEESRIAGLWREVLGVDRVERDDDFFRLGGSSLQLVQLANRLRSAYGRTIALDALLSPATVTRHAELVEAARHDHHRIERAPREGGLPLSAGQQRIWLLDRLDPGSREWVSGVFLTVPAGVPESAVRQALDALAARHESLRTRYAVVDGEPKQYVQEPRPVPLRTVAVPRAGLGDVLADATGAGFDLERGHLVRALLHTDPQTVPDGSRTLVLLVHHIASDGWSSAILTREFDELLAGRGADLPEPPIQYADFAAWERAAADAPARRADLDHWRADLAGATATELRTDRLRPAVRDSAGAVVPFAIPEPLARSMTELGRDSDATAFMTMLTALAVLLARYTGQWDVVVGAPVAGRSRPETENVVGFFLNSVVLRCRLDGAMTVAEALERVRDVCKQALSHQSLPFDELVADLAPPRDSSRTPLYQVAFDFHGAELSGAPEDEADLDTLVHASRVAKTDLTLYVRPQPDGAMVGLLEYATSLFERATIERMAGQLIELVSAICAHPAGRLSELDFLPAGERELLTGYRSVPARTGDVTVLDGFERQAAATPRAIAVVTDQDELTYAELDAAANRFAHHLRSAGAGPESTVGVLLDRGPVLPVALLGIWKAGAAYLPLDPQTPAARAGLVLADAGARLLVTAQSHLDRLGDAGHDVAVVAVDRDAAVIDAADARRPERDTAVEALAYVIYTSGSTGSPKGVQVTHSGLAGHVNWAVQDLASRGTGGAPVFLSVAFDLVVPNLWAPLLAGQAVRLLPQDLDLTELGGRLLAAGSFSFIKLTPGYLDILRHQLDAGQMSALAATIVVAGEELPVPLADAWAAALGPENLINEYGPTETTVGASIHPVTAPVRGERVPIGRPLPGVTLHVLDDRLAPQPIGVVGELHVGGAGVARGYAGRPAATAERFLPDPSGPPGSRIYRTGDLARLLPGGTIEFLGRRDEQVKVRGYRIEPGEVAAVLRDHPAVRTAAVVVNGTGEAAALVAYVVPADPAAVPADLAAFCAERLPAYLVPAAFVPLAGLPLTANGKLDRGALPPATAPAEAAPSASVSGVVQERIAEIFAEHLGVPVDAGTHFFAAGGNSILAIRVIAAIQAAFDVPLSMRTIFDGDTVAEIAAAVEQAVTAEIAGMSDEEVVASSSDA